MTIEEVRKQIRENVKIEALKPESAGGQSVGLMYFKWQLTSYDLDLKITFGHYKSSVKNKEFLNDLFEVILSELVG